MFADKDKSESLVHSGAMATGTPMLGDRSLFSRLELRSYLNHAGIAVPSDPVLQAIERVTHAAAARGSLAFGEQLQLREQLRGKLARLFTVEQDELALVPNTMYGLASLALSIDWRPRDRIIAFSGEYPTNVTPFQRAAALFGLTITLLPVTDFAADGGIDLTRLRAELELGRVRLCAFSAVQFQTGLRMPAAEIIALCHQHGAEVVIDGVQAAGAVPLDLAALDVDYFAAGAHKWLMGIEGAGVLFVKRRCMPGLRPAIAGNLSHVAAADMLLAGPGHLRYDRPLRSDAQVFEGGMLAGTACAALDASLGLILTLGAPAIYAHVNAYLDPLEAQLVALGFRSLRAKDQARRSCTLGVIPPSPFTAVDLSAELATRGIACSCPDGVLRFAPHWPNHVNEVPLITHALQDIME